MYPPLIIIINKAPDAQLVYIPCNGRASAMTYSNSLSSRLSIMANTEHITRYLLLPIIMLQNHYSKIFFVVCHIFIIPYMADDHAA